LIAYITTIVIINIIFRYILKIRNTKHLYFSEYILFNIILFDVINYFFFSNLNHIYSNILSFIIIIIFIFMSVKIMLIITNFKKKV